MTPQSHDRRLHEAGRQVMAARKRQRLSRVDLAQGAAISERSIARLEGGEEVRLSTYLAVIEYLNSRMPSLLGLTKRVAALPERGQRLVLEIVAQLEKKQQS